MSKQCVVLIYSMSTGKLIRCPGDAIGGKYCDFYSLQTSRGFKYEEMPDGK